MLVLSSKADASKAAQQLKRKRKRFAAIDEKQFIPPTYVDLPVGMSMVEVDQFFREQRLDELTEKLKKNELEFGDPDIRPPSPPPCYDAAGVRTNSREIRVKNSMQKEYHRLISSMIKRLEGYIPPADYKPLKLIKRVEIPQDRYPDVNFTGMILGPRGLNHKRIEEHTGCQISIRGRGARGQSAEMQSEEEQNMPLHVCIISEDDDKITKAIEMIEPLVDPLHPEHEQERMRGLEQLAIITGTTQTLQQRQLQLAEASFTEDLSYNKIDIVCKVCGNRGHVTSDCPTVKSSINGSPDSNIDSWRINNEYDKLLSELGGSAGGSSAGRPSVSTSSNTPAPPVNQSQHPLSIHRMSSSQPVVSRQPVVVPSFVPQPLVQALAPPPPPAQQTTSGKKYIPPVGFPPGFHQ